MKVIKTLEELLPILLQQGYSPDDDGDWSSHANKYVATAHMLTQCGQVPSDAMEYAPTWLDEKIEYPCIMKMTNGSELVYFIKSHKGVVIDTGGQPSEWEVGEWDMGWDMAHFKLYATVNKIGEN